MNFPTDTAARRTATMASSRLLTGWSEFFMTKPVTIHPYHGSWRLHGTTM